jgi:predicted amidohydrolase YtcJ
MDLITKPPMTQQQMEQYFNITINDALRYGLTSIHDAASVPEAISFFKE